MAGDQLGDQSWDDREGGSASDHRRCCEPGSGWKLGAEAPTTYVRRELDGMETVAGLRSKKATVGVMQRGRRHWSEMNCSIAERGSSGGIDRR